MLRKIEWGIAALLTLLAMCLHFVFLRHAGGLWRDEASTVNLATMPRLSDVWAHLHYDSFPVFWVLVLRFWAAIGLASDTGLRFLGFLVGLSILSALWFNARALKISFPMIALLLLGFCPTFIIWGDSMRAWGWGILWILLTIGLVWRLVESPRVMNFVFATLAAIASVQSTYYNSVLVFAICIGGLAVAVRRHSWATGVALLGVGLAAAISMLIYLGVLRRGSALFVVLHLPYGFNQFIPRLGDALRVAGTFSVQIWVCAFVVGMVVAVVCQWRPAKLNATPLQRDLLLYCMATLVTALLSYFIFLKNLQVPTLPWYYAALLAVAAMTLDAMISVAANVSNGQKVRLASVVVALIAVFSPVWSVSHTRMTNADLLAKSLSQTATKGDLIIINPWYCAIPFKRYYSGPAVWTGLPDIKVYDLHRFDAIKAMMTMPEPSNAIQDVRDATEKALKSGGRIWFVDWQPFHRPEGQIPRLLPAPTGPSGWYWGYYSMIWNAQIRTLIGSHAKSGHPVQTPAAGLVNPYENLYLLTAEGWRDDPNAAPVSGN